MSGQKWLYEEFWGLTVLQALEELERRFAERTLFSYWREGGVQSVTYGGFVEDVRRLAARFDRLGLENRRIIIDVRNTYEQVAAMFAAMSMGAAAASLCFDLQREDLWDLFQRLDPALVVYDGESGETVREFALRSSARFLPCVGEAGEDSVRGILDGDGPLYADDGRCRPGDPALILATSGSTSRSKLVVLSHYAVVPHIRLDVQKTLVAMPLYHVAALCMLANDMGLGVPICLSNPRQGLRDIQWYHPSNIFAVPSFVSLMAKRSRMGALDLSGFRSICSGGAAQDRETAEYLKSRGIFFVSLYGATETFGAVTYATPARYRAGSVGAAAPWNEVRISDQGEVLVRGKNVMLEYLGDPEATREAMADGWYRTGDAGYLDGDGFLFLTGRLRNIIVLSNGENISPEAIESKLTACAEIEEVVIRCEKDRLTAHIWCGADGNEEKRNRIRAFIEGYNRTVPAYQAIRGAVFRGEPFAKTASGKIKR